MTTATLAAFIKSFTGISIPAHSAIFWALRLATLAEADGDFDAAAELRRQAARY